MCVSVCVCECVCVVLEDCGQVQSSGDYLFKFGKGATTGITMVAQQFYRALEFIEYKELRPSNALCALQMNVWKCQGKFLFELWIQHGIPARL